MEESKNMIVVGSAGENFRSSWVEAEWRLFINELRSGRKQGNIMTVITPDLTLADLPLSLRYYEVIPFGEKALPVILSFLKK
ncbi:MAG: hypothetical protein ACTSU9_01190 [Promethearchaeota archaeon]